MTEHLHEAAFAAPYDSTVEPLRSATHYTGEAGCIADARGFAEAFLNRLRSEWCAVIDEHTSGDLLLLVSELVTNADRHSHGPYILEMEGTGESVAVTVYDSSAAMPRRFPRDPRRVGGHGLEIVAALADEVAVERVPVGKRLRAVVNLSR